MIEFMVQFQGAKTFSFGTVAIRQATLNNNAGTSNALCEQLTTLCGHGLLKEALYILRGTDHKHLRLSCFTYASLLQLCLDKRSLPGAKRVHTHLTETGFTTNIYLAHKLVVLYAKLGSLQDARLVLDDMEVKNVASWTNMIQAYSKHGADEEALSMFCKMQGNGIQPDHFTFATVLPVCANLVAIEEGKQMHGHIIKRGFQSDVFVGSALVDMYAKCGYIENARKVFDKMPKRNLVLWTAIVAGYAKIGDVDQAMELFETMPERNVYSWSVMVTAYAQAMHRIGSFVKP
ncbi:putative pentatricopeptide repeat-containing protein At3g13770, mitochondrial [Cryptomeria japonica]|uniref:putative pentatricopeptide repeat-containing protein At3g13770, mitochondrial n=1 Tax=Cryptomeria japonica TaxID=3369 RepID=UPI0027D9F522|nr:putative pentatricopeptide repeat-containing protein At3g13770, mitochondrial [Cryptomeria japonica]